jgi:hypothetical protein
MTCIQPSSPMRRAVHHEALPVSGEERAVGVQGRGHGVARATGVAVRSATQVPSLRTVTGVDCGTVLNHYTQGVHICQQSSITQS